MARSARQHALIFALGLLLAALTVFVYQESLSHDFVHYDDDIYVGDNVHLEKGLSWATVRWAFTPYESNWIPLTWLSLAADYARGERDPAVYHQTNVALHALSSALLFWAMVSLTRAPARSLFVAAVFALHPLHVESVAWVAERKDVLCGLFWMAAMWAYAAYSHIEGGNAGRRCAGSCAVFTLTLLALLSKPMAVTLPFVFLLLDVWPLGRVQHPARLSEWRPLLVEKAPLFLLVGLVAAITFVVQDRSGAVSTIASAPPLARLANASIAYLVYLRQTLWPADLAVLYPHAGTAIATLPAVASAAGLAIATGAAFSLYRRAPAILVGWLWFLGTTLPVIGLVQVGLQAHADRYMYLPQTGLAIAVAFGVAPWEQVPKRLRPLASLSAVVLAVAMVCALGFRTSAQIRVWRDGESLFRHALAVTEGHAFVHDALGVVLLRQGAPEEAASHFRTAARKWPGWPEPLGHLGDALVRQGEPQAALTWFERALRLNPGAVRVRMSYAGALLEAGRTEAAIREIRTSMRARPDTGLVDLHLLLTTALLRTGAPAQAAEHARSAISLQPSSAEARLALAFALAVQGRPEEAHSAFRAAERLGLGTPRLRALGAETLSAIDAAR